MLGIEGYEPEFFEEATAFCAAHAALLRSLVGQGIRTGWGMWSRTDNEWFSDGPVLLLIGDQQVELSAFQLGFALSCDQIVRSAPLLWCVQSGEGDGLDLYWKERSPLPLAEAAGTTIENIEIIECTTSISGKLRWVMGGIGFRLGEGYLAVYNALDELGLASERPQIGPHLRIEPL